MVLVVKSWKPFQPDRPSVSNTLPRGNYRQSVAAAAKFVLFGSFLIARMAKLTREDLLELFETVKKELQQYEKGSVKARGNATQPAEGKYDLWSEKDLIDPLGKPRKEMNFASLVVQSNYLGFYYIPVYCNPKLAEKLAPELMKT